MSAADTAKLPIHPHVPPDEISQANAALGELRLIKADIDRIQARLDADVARLVSNAQREAQSAIEQIPALEARLTTFAEEHRSELAKGRGANQTITLPNGKLVWAPTKLSISVDDENAALADIARRGWEERFTESKRVVIKDKLKETNDTLKDARKIKGVTVNDPAEHFQIKLSEIRLKTDTKLKTTPTTDEGEPCIEGEGH